MVTMNKYELQTHPSSIALQQAQEETQLKDIDFVRRYNFAYSASTWAKIKRGSFSGSCTKALAAIEEALYKTAQPSADFEPRAEGKVCLLPHILAADAATELGRCTADEHRLIIITGEPGSGKSTTARYLTNKYNATQIDARPSWSKSYLTCLTQIAAALGATQDYYSASHAENAIIKNLSTSPRLLIIDEANHFCPSALNFLKTLLNETKCVLCLLTLPNHLQKISAQHQEESRQLLRRAIEIIRIPNISTGDVEALISTLYPHLKGCDPVGIANLANRYAYIDTAIRILDEMDSPAELPLVLLTTQNKLK